MGINWVFGQWFGWKGLETPELELKLELQWVLSLILLRGVWSFAGNSLWNSKFPAERGREGFVEGNELPELNIKL